MSVVKYSCSCCKGDRFKAVNKCKKCNGQPCVSCSVEDEEQKVTCWDCMSVEPNFIMNTLHSPVYKSKVERMLDHVGAQKSKSETPSSSSRPTLEPECVTCEIKGEMHIAPCGKCGENTCYNCQVGFNNQITCFQCIKEEERFVDFLMKRCRLTKPKMAMEAYVKSLSDEPTRKSKRQKK